MLNGRLRARFGRSLAARMGYPMRNVLLTIVLAALSMVAGCGGNGSNNGSNGPTLQSISVTASSANIVVNQTVQMTATGTYSDKTTKDLTTSVSWSSSSTSIATISASGILTAKSNGTASITATMNSVSGSSQVTITAALVSIAITPAGKSIARETALQFTATGSYSDSSTQNITASVNWSSSNVSVATISNTSPTKGFVHGVSAGTVTISATSGSISGTATLTITSATATSLAIAPTNASLPLDVSRQFTATATFSDGTSQDVTDVVTWSSQSSSIATITVSGLVTAKNLGTTNIMATFESASDSTPLTVNASDLASISIQPANGSIAPGTTVSFTATGTFDNGSTLNLTGQVMWSTSNASIAKLVGGGVAEGIAPGAVTITATLGSESDSVPLTVTNATIQSITLTPYAQTVPTGWHQVFTATGVFSDSSSQNISGVVQWSSDNPSVATVKSNYGTVYAASQGTANIQASFSYAGASATGTAPLAVISAVLQSISLTPASVVLAPGSGRQYNAVGTWSNGSSENISLYVTWSSSNNSVAEVNSAGLVTGESAGVATITVQQGSLSATASLVVEGSALISIQVTPQGSGVPAGIDKLLQATGNFADGQSLNLTSAVTWTSSSPSVATISNTYESNGVVMGIAPGTTTITAVFDGESGTATLTVTNATLDSIAVSPANPTISVGASEQFVAKGTFSDGSVLPIIFHQATWSSSNAAVATINSAGIASSASAGTCTIEASLKGVSGSTNLTVQ
jgi:trimeric autotransporter adhesin